MQDSAKGELIPEVRGVKLGIITGSLGQMPEVAGKDPIDTLVEQCVAVGAANIEFVNSFLEPRLQGSRVGNQMPAVITPEYEKSRAELRNWRLNAPLARFSEIQRKFAAAGLNLFSCVMTFTDDFTPEEIDAVFRQMQALKVKVFSTNQTRVSTAALLVPYAEKYGISPAFHTHAASQDMDEVASVESLDKLMKMSPRFMINLDIGHFVAGNNDPVAYLREHHTRVSHIHVKDRKRNNGPNVEWGTGDTPIAQTLQLIRDGKYPIIALVEREFRGSGTPFEETKKDLEYMRRALLA